MADFFGANTLALNSLSTLRAPLSVVETMAGFLIAPPRTTQDSLPVGWIYPCRQATSGRDSAEAFMLPCSVRLSCSYVSPFLFGLWFAGKQSPPPGR